jgi:hypothetical protein
MRLLCRAAGAVAVVRLLCAAALVAALAQPLSAAEAPATQFETANKAYFDGDYKAARKGYESLVAELGEAPTLLYNLGNTAYQLERYGWAVYYFEKVARLGDAELAPRATENIAACNKALQARYKTKIEKGIYRYDNGHGIWYAVLTLLPPTLGLVLFLLFAVPLLAALFLWTFARRQALTTTGRIAFLSCLLPALMIGTLYFGRIEFEATHTFAVVVSPNAQLYEAPDTKSPASPLPEGLEVRVQLRNEQGFYKIERAGNEVGYAAEADLKLL